MISSTTTATQLELFKRVYAISKTGERMYPCKMRRGDKNGKYCVNFTNDTNNFVGLTEEELIAAILAGRFRDRGTIRMLPLNAKPGMTPNAFSPLKFDDKFVKDY